MGLSLDAPASSPAINREVRLRGVEPPRPFGHKPLKLARLPIPPQPQEGTGFYGKRAGRRLAMGEGPRAVLPEKSKSGVRWTVSCEIREMRTSVRRAA